VARVSAARTAETVALPRARAGAVAMFFLTGALFASWAARIPALQDNVGASAGQLGVAFAALNAGAVGGLPAGAALVVRRGSPAALRIGFAVFAAALAAAAFSASLGVLVVALVTMAAGNSVVDVAMNAQGVELERRAERPLLSGLHAGHSLGVLAGGLVGTAAAAGGVDVRVHLAVCAATGLVAVQIAAGALAREPDAEGAPAWASPSGRLLLLGAIAFLAFLAEGAANDWSAVHLRRERGAGEGTAAAAFTGFALALAVGRLAGDRLLARFGRGRVVRAAGLVAAAGGALALLGPGIGAAMAGWAVLGLGLALLAPAVLGAAARVGDGPPSSAIAAVTTVGYLGSFAGPAAVGALAGPAGLTTALALLLPACLLVTLLAGRALR
jgi:MFS family permease